MGDIDVLERKCRPTELCTNGQSCRRPSCATPRSTERVYTVSRLLAVQMRRTVYVMKVVIDHAPMQSLYDAWSAAAAAAARTVDEEELHQASSGHDFERLYI